MLTTDQKGAIAEAAITLAALDLGLGVSRPVSDERYDLILDTGRHLLRVQCKWAPLHGDVILLRCYSCRRTADGVRKRVYRDSEIDAFAAYCPELDRCFFLRHSVVPPGCDAAAPSRTAAKQSAQRCFAGPTRTISPLHWVSSKGP